VSNIDVDAIYVKNFDANAYRNAKEIAAEQLELTAELKNIMKQEDGTYHPADLMAHKL